MDLSTNELNTVYDLSQNQQSMIESRKKEYEIIMSARKKELIQVIIRQTEYTEIEAEIKLIEADYNVMIVLNNYHGVVHKGKDHPITTNQKIYGEIRNLMDTGAKSFRLEQEKAEHYKQYQESIEKKKMEDSKTMK